MQNKTPPIAIAESVIQRYFETLNAAEFEEAATLFATEGVLQPPFESAIEGGEAIAHYLAAESKGMYLCPLNLVTQRIEADRRFFTLQGHVQTPLFKVNVEWYFVVNTEEQILLVKVRLLARLENLLNMSSR